MRSVLISTSLSSLICSWLLSRCSQRSPSQQRFPWARQLKELILKEQITDDRVFFKMPFRPCPSGCGHSLSADDRHNRCLQCLGFQHAQNIPGGYSCRVNQSGACNCSDVFTSRGRKSETTMEDKLIVVVCGYPELYDTTSYFYKNRNTFYNETGAFLERFIHVWCLHGLWSAMLARAAVSIGLEVNRLPSPEPSQLDDRFLLVVPIWTRTWFQNSFSSRQHLPGSFL